jgi:hypothetical protein
LIIEEITKEKIGKQRTPAALPVLVGQKKIFLLPYKSSANNLVPREKVILLD